MVWFRAFIAGFFSTLIFHQGMLALLYFGKLVPRAPFAMTRVPPLGVPSVISLAFWGGLWGLLLWAMIRGHSGGTHWLLAVVLGALRSEEHTSELQSLMRISYAVFCLKKKTKNEKQQ